MKAGLSGVARSASAPHLLLVAAVSAGYESLHVHHFLNLVDEGLTLYAAMGLHRGGTLYADVAFVFPPGHVLVAWIAHALDPPGVVLARTLYAAFNVALCLALYALACRLMPRRWALLAALLVAVAAPLSHKAQLLFGYRYLVFSVLAMLAFARRLRTDDARWMLAVGVCLGVAVCFRLTPGFAAAVGIGLALAASGGPARTRLRDGLLAAAGALAVVLPVVLVFSREVGLEGLWREVVVRPVVMTDRQSLPVPPLALPESLGREAVHDAFVALLFRVCAAVHLGALAWLSASWLRARRAGRRFDHPLLLAVVVWGGVYYLRSLGRSDEPHLSSAIPPFCVVATFLLYRAAEGLRGRLSAPVRRALVGGSVAVLAGLWVLAPGADRALDPDYRGRTPFEPLAGRVRLPADYAWHIPAKLREIRQRTRPEERILDLSAQPLLYVLADRLGPGAHDVVMPGTFLDAAEERAFVAKLDAAPPSLVVLPALAFDEMESRSLARTAPILMAWIGAHYRIVGDPEELLLLEPRPRRELGAAHAAAAATLAPDPPRFAPVDPDRPLDRMLAALLRELDRSQVTDLLLYFGALETRLGWFEGEGAFYDPGQGIGIGRDLAARLEGIELERLREPLRLLLAHHQAHAMQSRIYTRESLQRPGNRALVEAQADVLAGISIAQQRMFSGRSLEGVREQAAAGVDFAHRVGRPAGLEGGLPSDRTRLRLLQTGRNVGVYYVKVWTCVTNLGEPETREVFDATVRSLRADLERNPRLPAFDPATCGVEDVFDWTLRAAERELARESAGSGDARPSDTIGP